MSRAPIEKELTVEKILADLDAEIETAGTYLAVDGKRYPNVWVGGLVVLANGIRVRAGLVPKHELGGRMVSVKVKGRG